MSTNKISSTFEGSWRCLLICMRMALIKSLLLKIPIKLFFSWFHIIASLTSRTLKLIDIQTLISQTIKCQTNWHIRIKNRYLTTSGKSIISSMLSQEINNSIYNIILLSRCFIKRFNIQSAFLLFFVGGLVFNNIFLHNHHNSAYKPPYLLDPHSSKY